MGKDLSHKHIVRKKNKKIKAVVNERKQKQENKMNNPRRVTCN